MRWLVMFMALPVSAHVMSMSSGDATVNGKRVDYVLRVPFYEVEQLAHPETLLLQHVRFEGGRVENQKCFRDGDSYVCAADYLFERPVENLDVTCTLYAVTVPNHVHVLRAVKDGKEDQAFFDYTFTSSTLRFQPPTKLGLATRRIVEGARRGVGGVVQVLFVVTLILAARSRKELFALMAAFALGAIVGAASNWQPAPRFAECAAALSVAYMAVEILFVPQGGWRWLIAAALGIFQGIYLGLLMQGEMPYFMSGAIGATILVCGLLGTFLAGRVHRFAACLPLAAGLFWFFARLWA